MMDPERAGQLTRALFEQMLECRLKMSTCRAKCPRCALRLEAWELEMVEVRGEVMQKIWWVCPNLKKKKCLFPMTSPCEGVYLLYRTLEEQRRDVLPVPRLGPDPGVSTPAIAVFPHSPCTPSPSTSPCSQNADVSSNAVLFESAPNSVVPRHFRRASSGADSTDLLPRLDAPVSSSMGIAPISQVPIAPDSMETQVAPSIRYVRIDDEETDKLIEEERNSSRVVGAATSNQMNQFPVELICESQTRATPSSRGSISSSRNRTPKRSRSRSPDIDVVGLDKDENDCHPFDSTVIHSPPSPVSCARCRPFEREARAGGNSMFAQIEQQRDQREGHNQRLSSSFNCVETAKGGGECAMEGDFVNELVKDMDIVLPPDNQQRDHTKSEKFAWEKGDSKSAANRSSMHAVDESIENMPHTVVTRRMRITNKRRARRDELESPQAIAKKNRVIQQITQKLNQVSSPLASNEGTKKPQMKVPPPQLLDRVYVRPAAAKQPVNRLLLSSAVNALPQAMTSRFTGYIEEKTNEESGSATARTMTPPSETNGGGAFVDLELRALIQRKLDEVHHSSISSQDTSFLSPQTALAHDQVRASDQPVEENWLAHIDGSYYDSVGKQFLNDAEGTCQQPGDQLLSTNDLLRDDLNNSGELNDYFSL